VDIDKTSDHLQIDFTASDAMRRESAATFRDSGGAI
jgi:hypothetical protein